SRTTRGQMNRAININVLSGLVNETSIGEVYASMYGHTDQNFFFGAGEAVQVLALDDAVRLGPLVQATLPCDGRDPDRSTPEIDTKVVGLVSLDLGPIGQTGVVESTSFAERNGLNGTARTSSEVTGLDLNVAGLSITADAISSVAHVETDDGAASVSTV